LSPEGYSMAPRPAWKGYLKLSLVTCAVELTNAITQSEKISFNILNRKTGNAVRRQYVDGTTGKPVDEKDEVKGYETGKDDFLLVEEEEIEAVQIESSHTLNLETFVKKEEIDPIYLDTPYYVTPADEVSAEAFAVIRMALEDKKMAGLARIVLWRRERPVVVEPFDKGMLLTTLHYDKEVRRPEEIFDDIDVPKLDPQMVELAEKVVESRKTEFDPKQFDDSYEAALEALIRAKKSGRKVRKPSRDETPERPSNVVNLFDALKKSLSSEEKPGKKAEAPKKPARGKPRKKTSA
jgi:DNA end-binding protein Ku